MRDEHEMDKVLSSLKEFPCIHCGLVGTLNRHDTLSGYDPSSSDKTVKRGRRAWCSNRGQRGGCGRTMSICFAYILPRHVFTAPLLDELLAHLEAGCSVQAAWEQTRIPLPLESAYHLLQRLARRLDQVARTLRKRCRPPRARDHPLRRTAALLHHAFPGTKCAVSEFQYTFQAPILG